MEDKRAIVLKELKPLADLLGITLDLVRQRFEATVFESIGEKQCK